MKQLLINKNPIIIILRIKLGNNFSKNYPAI